MVKGASVSLFEKVFLGLYPAKLVDYSQYFIQVRESKPICYLLAAIPLFTISVFCIIGGLLAGFMAPYVLADMGIKTKALLAISYRNLA